MQWLADSAGVTNRITRVYELDHLLSQLILHSESEKAVSSFVVEELLKTSSYQHDACTRSGVIHEVNQGSGQCMTSAGRAMHELGSGVCVDMTC